MEHDELTIRPYELGDENEINRGFNEVFNIDRSMAEWAWKFPETPGGRTIMLAEHEGRLVAHYAGMPVPFHLDGDLWTAAQIVDVYSRKAARGGFTRRGVWVRTVESFFETFGESGRLDLLFGFPSPRPLRLGVLQLGYDSMEPQPIVYLKRETPRARASAASLMYRAELARDWEPKLDELWDRVKADYPAAVVRDATYALRRFAGHPTARYHRFIVTPRFSTSPVGFAVYRTDGGSCRWVDLLWDRSHRGGLELMARLSGRLARQNHADKEEMWLNGDPLGQQALERLGFAAEPEPRKLVMVARSFGPDFQIKRLEGRIYLTLADSDLE